MGEIQAHGLAVSTPSGWEGRIYRRPAAGEVQGTSTDGPVAGAAAPSGEQVHPVVHVATIPLAADVADFASDAVDGLGPADAIVVLKEFDPSETRFVLFGARGMPRALDPDWFDPSSLQRTLPGQAGLQRFFQDGGRAFCLYVVLGAFARRNDVVPRVNEVLATIQIDPLGTSPPLPSGAPSSPPSGVSPGASPGAPGTTTTTTATTGPATPATSTTRPTPSPTTGPTTGPATPTGP
jgi:hypothetical protein